MRYIFTVLCVLLISIRGWSQQTIPKSAKSALSTHPLSFYSFRLSKKLARERIISDIEISNRDTSFFDLYLYDKVLFCVDKDRKRKNLLDSSYFFYCHFVNSDFSHSVFHSVANFNNSYFFSNVSFMSSSFREDVSFINTTFKEKNIFSFATFEKDVSFENVKFGEQTSFSNTTFKGKVSFDQVVFHTMLDFSKVKFGTEATFYEVQLPGFIYLHNSTFNNPISTDRNFLIDFRYARLDTLRKSDKNKKCSIQFDDTDVNRFLLPYDRFWLVFGPNTTYEEKVSSYESIIKNCREAGMTESVEGWDIDYRKLQTLHKHSWMGHIFNYFNSWWWNFGYDKWKILWWWLPLFFSLFLTYNYFRLSSLWNSMYRDTELGSSFRKPAEKEKIEPPISHGLQRFLFAFFYTSVIYFGFKLRHESVNYKNWRGLAYLYTMYAVGTIHMAFSFSYILSAY